MSDLVKFSDASSLGLHAMALVAGAPDRHLSARELAGRLTVSEHHLAKVLQRLARAGLLESVRGPAGGFALRGDPARITLLEIHEAIDGRVDANHCLLSRERTCASCILGEAVREATAVLVGRLSRTRLADVAVALAEPPAVVPLGPPGLDARPGGRTPRRER
jgi:Rrf2 family protein